MDTKLRQYQQIKKGTVWQLPVYRSGLSDNEFVGYAYYVVTEKQSMGKWKLKLLMADTTVNTNSWSVRRYENNWQSGVEIREAMKKVDAEQFKTAIVLYG